MPNFIFLYKSTRSPSSPEEGQKGQAAWGAWLKENGEKFVIPGNPLKSPKTVSQAGVSKDGGDKPLTGYSIVQADHLEAALELAQTCPFLEMGEIDVAELMKMPTS